MRKWLLIVVSFVLIIAIGLTVYVVIISNGNSGKPLNYTYSIVHTYAHDPTAFTEGLVYSNGTLYESTGLVGASSLRKVDLETGTVLQKVSLGDDFFGEGITVLGDNILQLTWESEKGFIYDRASFNQTGEFAYRGEGWGLTYDGAKLIMSNGSSTLTFLDPETFKPIGTIDVRDGNTPISDLNELEYINGDVYANVWLQNRIAIISMQTGQIKGWLDLTGIYVVQNADTENVLNGIAYDAQNQRLFVTGKRWSQLFEIKLVPAI